MKGGPLGALLLRKKIATRKKINAKKLLANNFLQILHQIGKRSQSILKPNNNKTRLTTAKLFVGLEVWEATIFPFFCKIANERAMKGKTHTFTFSDMAAL